jgi:putative DNA primase/helicase
MSSFNIQAFATQDKVEYTHQSLRGGKFNIPDEHYPALIEYMKKNLDLSLCEKLPSVFPLFFDIDKLDGSFDIFEIVEELTTLLPKYFQLDEEQVNTFYILQNQGKLDDLQYFHIYFPKIFVNKQIVRGLSKALNDIFDNNGVFDENSYNSCFRMPFTCKWDRNIRGAAPNTNYKFIEHEKFEGMSDFQKMKLVSIRYNCESFSLTEHTEYFTNVLGQMGSKKTKKNSSVNNGDAVENKEQAPLSDKARYYLNEISRNDFYVIRHILFSCLSDARVSRNDSWCRVGYILKNLEVPLQIFKDWSKTSSEYDEEWCEERYDLIYGAENEEGRELGLKSLFEMAQEDKPKEFAKICFGVSTHEVFDQNYIELKNIIHYFHMDDLGDAELFYKLYRKRIVCTDADKKIFFYWDGDLWQRDVRNYTRLLVATHLSKCYSRYEFFLKQQLEAENEPEKRDEIKQNLKAVKARIKQCRKSSYVNSLLPYITSYLKDNEFMETIDTNKDILSLNNGVLDLRTGRLRPRTLYDMCSFKIDIDYVMGSSIYEPTPNVDKFFNDIMLDDFQTVRFLQRLLGYSITGHISEQVFCVFWGALGSNGKSVLLELLSNLLEERRYMTTLSGNALMGSKFSNPGGPTPHLNSLHGARMAVLDESDKNAQLNEGLVKRLSGGSKLTLRKMREEEYTVENTSQLILITNHKPVISDDAALHRRLILVPFDAVFKSEEEMDKENPKHKLKDTSIKEKISKEELLRWMVKGSVEWYREREATDSSGLGVIPAKVKSVTDQYKKNSNMFNRFLEERCELPSSEEANLDYFFTSIEILHEEYCGFITQNIKMLEFKDFLIEQDYKIVRDEEGTQGCYIYVKGRRVE